MQTFPLNSQKQPACSSWKTYTGEVTTPMFGVTPPDGYLVIDLDSYKNDSLRGDVEKELGCSIDWEGSHIQSTPRGGTHHAFIVPTGIRFKQGANLFETDGFDTRVSGRGYIASGDGYEVIDADHVLDRFDDFLPELPPEAIEKLSYKLEVVGGTDGGDDDGVFRAAEIVFTNPDGSALKKSQMVKALIALPDEIGRDNDSWMGVCAGFKRQLLAMGIDASRVNAKDGWGFKTLTTWSRQRFDGSDGDFTKMNEGNYKRWLSFGLHDTGNADGQIITFARIVKLGGGIEQDSLAVSNELAQKRDDAPFVDDYVMEAKTGRFIHKDNLSEYCKSAFDSLHKHDTPLNAKGNPMKPSSFCEGVIEVVADTMYAPRFSRVFTEESDDRRYLNTYRAPKHADASDCADAEKEAALKLVKDHIAHLVDDPRERDIILYYLAHNVQSPGDKIEWGIILQGAPGDGKSFFSEMMRHVLGRDNVRVMNADTLQASFTGWAAGQCMVFIEELKLDNYKKYEIVNRIKPYISNPTVECTRKGKDPITAPNTSNYFCFTNYKDAVPIDDTDRRYAVFFSKWQGSSIKRWTEQNPDYYPTLYSTMRKSACAIHQALCSLGIPKWFTNLKRAPDSAAKNEMIGLTRPASTIDVEQAICDLSDKVMVDDDTINMTELWSQIIIERQTEGDDSAYSEFPDPIKNGSKLARTMDNIGWVKQQKRPRINDRRCTIYKRKT